MERMDADVEIINLEDTQQTEDRHKTRTDGNTVGDGTVGIKKEEENTTKMDGQEMEGSGCSSEDDSPESKKVRTDYDSDLDSDVFERDDDCLPDGYVRNNEGHIVVSNNYRINIICDYLVDLHKEMFNSNTIQTATEVYGYAKMFKCRR